MDPKEIGMRFGGLPLALAGLFLILFSSELLPGLDAIPGDRLSDLSLRGGFGALLMGLLLLFLFSFKTVPREVSTSFMLTDGRNTGRTLEAMNLNGNGILFPPVGRLKQDRIYIPLERNDLPLADLSDTTVFNVGSTGPSMGYSMIPPGKGFVDKVEELTGSRFIEESTRDGSEALERLSKGTGIFRKIEMRERGESIDLTIVHDAASEVCETLWKEYPNIHRQVGCPACSAVLCGVARIVTGPLRIEKAEKIDGGSRYRLRRKLK